MVVVEPDEEDGKRNGIRWGITGSETHKRDF
jgi:hypothetical protein